MKCATIHWADNEIAISGNKNQIWQGFTIWQHEIKMAVLCSTYDDCWYIHWDLSSRSNRSLY